MQFLELWISNVPPLSKEVKMYGPEIIMEYDCRISRISNAWLVHFFYSNNEGEDFPEKIMEMYGGLIDKIDKDPLLEQLQNPDGGPIGGLVPDRPTSLTLAFLEYDKMMEFLTDYLKPKTNVGE